MIATGSYEDGTLRLVESATGKLLSEIQVSMFGVGALAFSPDGKYLVTPSNEGTLNNGKYSRGGTIRVSCRKVRADGDQYPAPVARNSRYIG
jgi:WD40 repeat protein